MTARFRWFTYIPPELQLTRQQRGEVFRRGLRLWRGSPRDLIGFALALVGATLIQWASWWVIVAILESGWLTDVNDADGSVTRIKVLVLGGNALLLGIFLIAILAACRVFYRPHVLCALRECGWPVCDSCGYLVRGLPTDVPRCPECGVEREAMPESSS